MHGSSFAATIIKIVYGFEIEHTEDPYVAQMEKAMEAVVDAFTPGKYLVGAFPPLRFVPSWFPGAGFQKRFAAARQMILEVKDALCARTKQGVVRANNPMFLSER